jgi:hypothetical protein
LRARLFGTAAALLVLTGASSKEFGPADIARIAKLSDTDRAAFDNDIQGLAKFSGAGTVIRMSSVNDDGKIIVDTGKTGDVSCFASFEDIKPGDKVAVTGVIGGAMSADYKNTIGKQVPNPPNEPPPRQTDEITLIAGTCRLTKG